MSEWINIKDELPGFTVYGFHTGKKVRVKLKDGTEQKTIYQGYGEFGYGAINRFHSLVTHWKPAE